MEFLLLLFCIAITIHNMEEAIWLPAWSQQPARFQKPVSKGEFRFAVTVITLLAYTAAASYLLWPHSELAKWIITGFLGSMIVNTIFPHLLATLVMKKYAPGMITGLLLNIPVNSFILSRMHAENIISTWELVLSTAIVGGFILSLIPLLFKVGRKLKS